MTEGLRGASTEARRSHRHHLSKFRTGAADGVGTLLVDGHRPIDESGVTSLRIATIIAAVAASVVAAPRADGTSHCDCARFADELAAARAVYASRGEGATIELGAAARDRYRDRVLEAYERARCLVDCGSASERERDAARALLGETAFKSRDLGPTVDVARARVDDGLAETARCVTHAPAIPACDLWHASIVGVRVEDAWSPLQLALPRRLLAEFRAARTGAEPQDGVATRGEATVLMRAPRIAGGDTSAAVRLMEEARRAPAYGCVVDNRLVYAEALARSGAPDRALAELRSALAAGLPSCGDDGYENAVDLAEVVRCAARLEARPDEDPGWSTDCDGSIGASPTVSPR